MHLRIKKFGGKENKVEVWGWRNLEVIQGEVKDNWKRRNLKLKFEIKQVWLMKFRAKKVKIEET